jgi:type VI secretion system protein ImpM
VPEIAPAEAPGLYGKLPARGDFVRRRLDDAFVEAWDGWLQRAIAASREALGERWLECFLSAPVWRFVVPAGMFARAGWIGLIAPSVDRVGRYFPLTLAAPLQEDGVDAPATLARAAAWLDALEALALEALVPDLDFEAFDRRLAELAPPAGVAVAAAAAHAPNDDTVPLAGPRALFQVQQVEEAALLELLERGPLAPRTAAAWTTRGGESFGPCVALSDGLIPGGHFCALLDGRWAEHAWSVISNVTYCPPDTPRVDFLHGQGRGDVAGDAGDVKRGEAGPLTATPSSEQAVNTGLGK